MEIHRNLLGLPDPVGLLKKNSTFAGDFILDQTTK
jgi:hypothetical protein